MYKIRSKKFTILLTLIFVLSIMLPLAVPAAAATTYSALTKPTLTAGAEDVALGTLYIKIDPMPGGATAKALVTLPADFKITDEDASAVNVDWYEIIETDDNEFTLELEADSTGKVEVFLKLRVNVPAGFSGDVVADILNLSGQLPSGSVVLAVVAKGAVTISCSTPKYISDEGTVTFTLRENAAGALKKDNSSVKISLPKGFIWDDVDLNIEDLVIAGEDIEGTIKRDNDNHRVLVVKVTETSSSRVVLRFEADIIVDELEAKLGDVVATIGGKSSVTPSKLTVAKYADFGVKFSVKDPTEILAGRKDVEVGKIVIEETAPGSLIEGRTVLLTLPAGAMWVDEGDLDWAKVGEPTVTIVGDDDQTLRIRLGEKSAVAGGEITIEDATVATAANFRGDLKVTVSGSMGLTGEFVIATVKSPISVSAEKMNVKIGVQSQAGGDIIITETEAEALIKGKNFTITPSAAGITFRATPKATVTEGDVKVSLTKEAGKLTITVDADSVEASTIKISGITYDVDRTVAEGDHLLYFAGAALREVDFAGRNTTASLAALTVVTPAPGEEKQSAAFVIGSTTYTVNGVAAEMDVAPYVKDGRTYLPVRYAGYALGVAEENIFWDNSTGTATLIKGDRVVQFTIGQKAMVINGASVALDVAPEITNGRTMLPFRWIATAFGASVDWDGATQTVTMEL